MSKIKRMCAAKKKNAKPQSKPAEPNRRHIAENRKARFKYEVLEQIECGIVLMGSEVKSLRDNQISLDEAYVRVTNGELYLIGADIAEYKQATLWNHPRRRPRKLLVHSGQLKKLSQKAFEKGFTLIPLQVYFNDRGIVKLLVGVGRGKKIYDKRQSLKEADSRRTIDRAMKNRSR
ncbi:MAG: SsrA-binding protein SmpB [Pirellulaceae bacterium]